MKQSTGVCLFTVRRCADRNYCAKKNISVSMLDSSLRSRVSDEGNEICGLPSLQVVGGCMARFKSIRSSSTMSLLLLVASLPSVTADTAKIEGVIKGRSGANMI